MSKQRAVKITQVNGSRKEMPLLQFFLQPQGVTAAQITFVSGAQVSFRTAVKYLIITGNNIGPMTSKIAQFCPLSLMLNQIKVKWIITDEQLRLRNRAIC